jgi:archaemetzincin
MFFIACKQGEVNTTNVPEYPALAALDVPLGVPQPGEWLAEHKEKGQTFEDYAQLSPIQVSKTKHTIYIQPIGTFTPKEMEIVDNTVAYLTLFYQVKTIKLPVIADDLIPNDKRRTREDGSEQLDASYLIDKVIPKYKPKDALVVMGITSKDLYPKPSWNYVFGLANYTSGTGVTSLYRYEPNLEDNTICLQRTIKTSAHEIGHMFKLSHCTHAVCLMNGVNNLEEDDRKPNTLCSVCLRKLTLNFGFDNRKRFKELIAFMEKHRLNEDAVLLKKQYNSIKQ